MVLVVREGRCPKCGSQGLYITQEDWKPVTIKCRHRSKCGWEVDLKQFWPDSKCESCPVAPFKKLVPPAECVGCAREKIEKEAKTR